MNPFTTPDKVVVYARPQDMRAGIQRLAAIVTAEFGECDPMDGSLYVFVSRDCRKAKMLRFEINGWRMYYVRLVEGGFRWARRSDGAPAATVERRQLLWLLDGIDPMQPKAPKPVAARKLL